MTLLAQVLFIKQSNGRKRIEDLDNMVELKTIGAGLATSAMSGAGTGIGVVFAGLLVGAARNPFFSKQLFAYAILGFALTEAIALFGLMMAFLILFAV